MLLMVFAVGTSFAQIKWFKTNSISYKYETQYGEWTNWSEWEKCIADVKLDLDNNKIVIYTKTPQVYYIYDYLGEVEDDYGQTIKLAIIDDEDDYGCVRLRIQDNGTKQLYVDFSNIMWVYNLN